MKYIKILWAVALVAIVTGTIWMEVETRRLNNERATIQARTRALREERERIIDDIMTQAWSRQEALLRSLADRQCHE